MPPLCVWLKTLTYVMEFSGVSEGVLLKKLNHPWTIFRVEVTNPTAFHMAHPDPASASSGAMAVQNVGPSGANSFSTLNILDYRSSSNYQNSDHDVFFHLFDFFMIRFENLKGMKLPCLFVKLPSVRSANSFIRWFHSWAVGSASLGRSDRTQPAPFGHPAVLLRVVWAPGCFTWAGPKGG